MDLNSAACSPSYLRFTSHDLVFPCPDTTAMVSGHGKTKSYRHRFGIIDSQTCPFKGGDQTTEHLIHHCNILETQRDVMKQTIQKSGGKLSTANKELIAKQLRTIITFINSIDFDKLT